MEFQQGTFARPRREMLTNFDLEIFNGSSWISMNDQTNYVVGVDEMGNTAQTRRRITADSPFYDGTFVVHSTLDQVSFGVTIYVYGTSANHVTENVLNLIDLVSQDQFQMRVRMDDDMQTYLCDAADYSIDRSHVMAHNLMAAVKLQITRFPKTTYEVVL